MSDPDRLQAIKDRLRELRESPAVAASEMAYFAEDIAYLQVELERLREWVRRAYPVVVIAAAGNPPGDHWQSEAEWACGAIPLRSEHCRVCNKGHSLLPWEGPCHEA